MFLRAGVLGVVLAAAPAMAQQQGQFYLIGPDLISITGASDTGVVVGQSGDLAMRWTVTGGAEVIGAFLGDDWSEATGVSADGSVVVGTSRATGLNRAFRWTRTSGLQLLLPGETAQTFANAVSPDGVYATGYEDLLTSNIPYTVSTATGPTALPLPVGTVFGAGVDISADGQRVVGDAFSADGTTFELVLWVSGSPASLPFAPGVVFPNAYASAISADGHTAVGGWMPTGASDWVVARWVDGGNPQPLPGAGGMCVALDVSADGSVIVGRTMDRACRWTSSGAEDLTTLALAMGVDLGGAVLGTADAVSPSGLVIAGTVVIDGHDLGWVMVLPPGGCYANCDGSTNAPRLNIADFTCFLQRFAAGDAYANCDGSTDAPVLNIADFTCFLRDFAAGCP